MWETGGENLSISRFARGTADPCTGSREVPHRFAASIRSRCAPDAATDQPGQILDLAEGGVAGPNVGFHLLDPVQRGRMVATPEDLADLHQGEAGALPHEVHGDMTGLGERAR